jgi:ABC-type multidrug transport system fused ATPase/permease subunit
VLAAVLLIKCERIFIERLLGFLWNGSKIRKNHAELTSVRLGADIYTINHIISKYLPHLCAAFSNVIISILLAFIFEWRIALASIGLIPLMGVTGAFLGSMVAGYL